MARTILVFTTPEDETVSNFLLTEFLERQKKGVIPKDVMILSASDSGDIGSGGATLNGLLIAAEQLSVLDGYSLIHENCLDEAIIIIVHFGRNSIYSSMGNAFTTLPLKNSENLFEQPLEHIDFLIQTLISSAKRNGRPGVWVSSTDAFLFFKDPSQLHINPENDVIAFSMMSPISLATKHGVFKTNERGEISDFLYQRPIEELKLISEDQVPTTCGLLYFNVQTCKALLALSMSSPLDSCTYYGLDTGAAQIKISLFFDILKSMFLDTKQESFTQNIENSEARKALFENLSSKKVHIKMLDGLYCYFPVHLKQFLNLLPNICSNELQTLHSPQNIHSILKNSQEIEGKVINSYCDITSPIPEKTWIFHSHLSGNWTIGKNCYLSGISPQIFGFKVPDNTVLQLQRTFHSGTNKIALLYFGINDNFLIDYQDPRSKLRGREWSRFFELSGLTEQDIWPTHVNEENGTKKRKLNSTTKCFMNAKLFWLLEETELDLSSKQYQEDRMIFLHKKWSTKKTELWKNSSTRVSLQDVLDSIDLEKEFAWRKELSYLIDKQLIKDVFSQRFRVCALSSLKRLALEKRVDLLEGLDDLASTCDPDIAARTMASIAEFLVFLAHNQGECIRSGPFGNTSWKHAYDLLIENQQSQGILALSNERKKWMNSPKNLLRAARHYEGACQILIRNSVLSANEFISTTESELSLLDKWVICQAPARIDIAGGWTDTPPITYENGGVVLNIAIRVNDQLPIGAKVRRIKEFQIVLVQIGLNGKETKMICQNLEDLSNYNQPLAFGALLKASLIVANVIDLTSSIPLQEQLKQKYNSGFELHTWTDLPHGSGLGSSSILAGVLLNAISLSMGKKYSNHESLIHAVLVVEQLMTTGGGWQDQVGGIYPNAKLTISNKGLPLKVKPEVLEVKEEFLTKLNKHLFLLYTGKTRLARDLLQSVIRRWYSQREETIQTTKDLVENAFFGAEGFRNGNIEQIGTSLNRYWSHKKRMATGSEPEEVTNIIEIIKDDVYGVELTGAGGGGFLFAITKQEDSQDVLWKKINNQLPRPSPDLKLFACQIDSNGLVSKMNT